MTSLNPVTAAQGVLGLPAEIWNHIYELLFSGSEIVAQSPIWEWKVRNPAILLVCRRTWSRGMTELYRHIQLIVSMADNPNRLNTLPLAMRQRLQRIELVECKLDHTQRAGLDLTLFPAMREVTILSKNRLDCANKFYVNSASMSTNGLCGMVQKHDFLLDRMQAKVLEVRKRQRWIDNLVQTSPCRFQVILVATLRIVGRRPSWRLTNGDGEFAVVRVVCFPTAYLAQRVPMLTP